MPLIQVTMREGRDAARIRAMITALTEAAVDSLAAPKESVRVIVNEVPGTHWANGDVTLEEKAAKQTQ
ncbi:4-oxalocrotonate tautomerase [Amycolatopsis acidicola]|uniref:4-oxalocrotonate tautomerase n=1 Tax=Amycolatopsis acidicola TaxID=2596893 RepID=A0A5N0UWF4_9PSEU|nr:tautomerase family protein [Amycolatopsis acidicola]KAA9155267.1 4-oxalocrotonate tautomerase [Amycolatopsis acidicola]